MLAGTRTTGQIISYRLMAAYAVPFYTLLSVNGRFCRLVKINFVFFTLKTQLSFRASPVSINANTAGLSSCQNADRQTNRQTDGFSALYSRRLNRMLFQIFLHMVLIITWIYNGFPVMPGLTIIKNFVWFWILSCWFVTVVGQIIMPNLNSDS